jgi:hypothetical protein
VPASNNTVNCPAIFDTPGGPRIALAAPLAGRRIYALPAEAASGQLRPPVQLVDGSSGRLVMPRLIGFAPADARRAAEAFHLSERIHWTHTHHGLPRVIAQSPSPGTAITEVIPYAPGSNPSVSEQGVVTLEIAEPERGRRLSRKIPAR